MISLTNGVVLACYLCMKGCLRLRAKQREGDETQANHEGENSSTRFLGGRREDSGSNQSVVCCMGTSVRDHTNSADLH